LVLDSTICGKELHISD